MNALKGKLRAMVDSAMPTMSVPKRLLNFDPSTPGRRLWPSDTPKNNAEWEIRLDVGEARKDHADLVGVKLQINREAKTKGLKDLAKANGTHHTYATTCVNVKEPPTKEAADRLVD